MVYKLVRDNEYLNSVSLNNMFSFPGIKKTMYLVFMVIIFYLLFKDVIHRRRVRTGEIHSVKQNKN
jgi:hypothetical protein